MTSGASHPRSDPAPLTERVLRRLGPPRALWIAIWSCVPLVSPLVFASAARISGEPLLTAEFVDRVATQVGLAFATFVLLVGTRIVARRAADVEPTLARLDPDRAGVRFGRLSSISAPLVLAAVVAVVVSVGGFASYGPVPPLAALPLLFAYLVPIMTFVWVDVVILLELDGLGRRPLALVTFPEDPSLGLEDVGSLASTGLGLLLIAVAPILVVGSDEPVTLGISLAVVAVVVGGFVLSMYRLHRQLAAARRTYRAFARRLYAEAYEPLRASPTAETLEARAAALRAAEALDARARGVLTWPLDEGAVRFVAVVISSVVTSVIVRALFAALGF